MYQDISGALLDPIYPAVTLTAKSDPYNGVYPDIHASQATIPTGTTEL
jgi:hypothetical protein